MLKIDDEISMRIDSQTNNELPNDNQNQESIISEDNESITSVSILQTQSQSLFAGLSTPSRACRDLVNSQIENDNQNHESTLSEENESIRSVSPVQIQSQSLFSGQSTPIAKPFRDISEDRFNGILYHVIPSDGQITIIFSSKDLYFKFISSIDKELHAQPISEVKSNYTTHIRGKWCTLTSDNNAASISATGPGHKLWREMIFSRLAIHLYQQYTRETDDVINQTLSQTSTPALEKDIPVAPLPPTVSPVKPTESTDIVQQMPLISSISRQVEELTKISRFLQEQLTSINSKIDMLLNSTPEPKSDKTNIQAVSVTSINDDSTYVTLDETKEDSKLAPGEATYSQVLSKSVDKPEQGVQQVTEKSVNRNGNHNSKNDKVKQGHSSNQSSDKNKSQQFMHSDTQNNRQSRVISRTLIIGDSIINGINRKGLTNNVECQSIPGANIDSIIDKLQIYDLKKFSNIIVYVGGNNASNETDPEYFEEKYEQLITSIKNTSSNSKLFLCTSCPRGDTDVTEVNEVIMRLCHTNELICIDTNAGFYDKHNRLRHHFFKPRDNIHLSRSGIKRLLGTINQHLCVVDNFEKCVYNINLLPTSSTQSRVDQTSQRVREFRSREINHTQTRQRPVSINHNTNNFGQHDSPAFIEARYGRHNNDNHQLQHQIEKSQSERCMKCGLSNHTTFECKHQKQVRCFKCHCYGHKDSSGLCWDIK
ncbi:MAG: GDSL-type esterase/lipase family protein [Candidatus Thiodiazotropha sp.]